MDLPSIGRGPRRSQRTRHRTPTAESAEPDDVIIRPEHGSGPAERPQAVDTPTRAGEELPMETSQLAPPTLSSTPPRSGIKMDQNNENQQYLFDEQLEALRAAEAAEAAAAAAAVVVARREATRALAREEAERVHERQRRRWELVWEGHGTFSRPDRLLLASRLASRNNTNQPGAEDGDDRDTTTHGLEGGASDVDEDHQMEGEVEEGNETADQTEETSAFDPGAVGLKEISNLAQFQVSSYKPNNGVRELKSEDLAQYWQSDGPQPHHLTIHFIRRVEIRAIRFYVDFNQDESYTPTKIRFVAGTGLHDLRVFAEMELSCPEGWQDVPVESCGGGADGNSLCCFVVQMQVLENHQNGKDTHIRGLRLYALDDNAEARRGNDALREMLGNINGEDDSAAVTVEDEDEDDEVLREAGADADAALRYAFGEGDANIPDFMKDPEIR